MVRTLGAGPVLWARPNDSQRRLATQISARAVDFARGETTTRGLARTGEKLKRAKKTKSGPIVSDHTPEEYMAKVETVREGMRQGDYYEVVLRQTFRAPYSGRPSELFDKIQHASPSPYEFFLQLGEEQLIGASPEMFVRIEGRRIETCPIAGTARRTGDPLRKRAASGQASSIVPTRNDIGPAISASRNVMVPTKSATKAVLGLR